VQLKGGRKNQEIGMMVHHVREETKLDRAQLELGIAVEMIASDGRKYMSHITRSIQLRQGQVLHDQAVELLIEISEAHNRMLRKEGLPTFDDRLEIAGEKG
jgi:hypothetical protein